MIPSWLNGLTNFFVAVTFLPLAYLYARLLKAIVDALVEPAKGTRWTWWPVAGVFVVTAVASGPLDFKQVAYGSTGIVCSLMTVVWLRNLLRGEHWLPESPGRLDTEYFGPVTLGFIGAMFTWSAFDPFF